MEFEFSGSDDFGRVIAAMNKILYSEKGNQAAREPEDILINARLTAGILRAALARDETGSLARELQGVGRVIVNDEEFLRASGDRQQMVPFAVAIHGNNDQYEFTANGFMRGIGAAMFAREGLPVTFDRTADAFVLTRPRGVMGRVLALAERWTGRTEQAEEIIGLVNRVSNQVQGKIYDEKDLLPEVEPSPDVRVRPRQGFEVDGPAGRPGFGREIAPALRRFDEAPQGFDPARGIDARPDRAALPESSRLRPDLPLQDQRHFVAVLGWLAGRSDTRNHWEYANTESSGRNFRLYTDTSGLRAERQTADLDSLGIPSRTTENARTFLMVTEDVSRGFSHIEAAFNTRFPNVTEEALGIFREHGIRTRHFAGLGRVVEDRDHGGVSIITEEQFGREYMDHGGVINRNMDDPLPPVLASFQSALPRSVRAEVVGGISGTALHISGMTLSEAELIVEHYQEEQQAREIARVLNSAQTVAQG